MQMNAAQIAETTLDTLGIGRTGVVVELTNSGAERRRMLDLGILPGTPVTLEMISPLGDPRAYRVRGAVIALRQQQARSIRICLESPEEHADVTVRQEA